MNFFLFAKFCSSVTSGIWLTLDASCLIFVKNLFDRFDLANANINDPVFDKIPPERRPDIVLVRKYYGDKTERNKRRKWRLRRLEREAAGSTTSTNERCVSYSYSMYALQATNCFAFRNLSSVAFSVFVRYVVPF